MRAVSVSICACFVALSGLAACAHSPPPGPGPAERAARSTKSAAGLLLSSFDADQDFQVSQTELNTGLDRAFARADGNGDGDISPLEFDDFEKKALDGGRSPPFRLDFDRNVDGRITHSEFQSEIRAIADNLDADHDGALTHAELSKATPDSGPADKGVSAEGGERRGPPPGGGIPPR